MIPMTEVKQGDAVVVGHDGIRVQPMARSRDKEIFSFMNADVSSERPKRLVISQIAREMRETKERGGKILFVGGPAIVHSGAAPSLAKLIRSGYVNVLFGGNAIAVHDCEAAIFGTSLGVALTTGQPVEGGHRHHMRAINRIRRAGSLRDAVEKGHFKKRDHVRSGAGEYRNGAGGFGARRWSPARCGDGHDGGTAADARGGARGGAGADGFDDAAFDCDGEYAARVGQDGGGGY